MRIALLLSGAHVNGVTVHVHLLVKFLVSRGHKILLVHRKSPWIEAQPGFQDIERFEALFSLRPSDVKRVGERILQFDADVIHTHMSTAHAYGAIYRLFGSIPVVATAHSTHIQPHWLLNHRVIATSPIAARFHHRFNLVPQRSIRTIPNFVDTVEFRPPSESERRAARTTFELPMDALVIGFVGRLGKRKRPEDLIRAFAHLAHVRQDAWLLLVGKSRSLRIGELRKLAISFGIGERVVITGQRSDVPKALAAMDIFAHASSWETGPIAALEAVATGLPVVATDVGMMSVFVREGETGYIVAVGDTVAFGQRLVALASDKARRIRFGAAGRAHIECNFTPEIIGPQVEAVLAETAAMRRPPLLGFLVRAFGGSK